MKQNFGDFLLETLATLWLIALLVIALTVSIDAEGVSVLGSFLKEVRLWITRLLSTS